MKRRGVKLAARFLRIPLKDRGQALPRGASRPMARAEAARISNDRHGVEDRPELLFTGRDTNGLRLLALLHT